MKSALFQALVRRLKPYASGLFPDPPSKPPYPGERFTVTTRAWGHHSQGNYVMAYIPDRDVPDRPSVVIYLHGFAFGNPYFYDAHMQHLASQGSYVFFVDYQADHYPDTQSPQPPGDDWNSIAQFAAAAVESFRTSGPDMIRQANQAVQAAMRAVLPQPDACDIHLFGHSVGGLFALSWPYYNGAGAIRGIVAADPIPATASLPTWLQGPARDAARSLPDLPFLNDPVKASETGQGLADIPTAILIGNSDLFVKVSDWQKLWPNLATDQKQIYISQTDTYYGIYRCDDQKALIAYHNQSVTNTLLYGPEDLQLLIGGAGIENDLRWRFVWAATDALLAGVPADQLRFAMGRWSNGKAVHPIQAWPGP